MEPSKTSLMHTEVYEAFIDAGASEGKAKAAATSIPVGEQLASKNDLDKVKAEITEVKTEIARVEVRMANEFKTLYRNLWLMAASIVTLVLGLGKFIF